MIVKCPNCGESSQLKNEFPPHLSDNKQILSIGFSCDCGCYFVMDHELNDEGVWEHTWTSVEYIEK